MNKSVSLHPIIEYLLKFQLFSIFLFHQCVPCTLLSFLIHSFLQCVFKINLSYAIFSQPFSTRLSCLKHSTNLCFVNLFMSLPFFFNHSQLNYPFNNFYFINLSSVNFSMAFIACLCHSLLNYPSCNGYLINLSSVNFCMLMPLFTQLPFLQWLFYQPFLWQPLSYLYSMSVSINHSQLNYPF